MYFNGIQAKIQGKCFRKFLETGTDRQKIRLISNYFTNKNIFRPCILYHPVNASHRVQEASNISKNNSISDCCYVSRYGILSKYNYRHFCTKETKNCGDKYAQTERKVESKDVQNETNVNDKSTNTNVTKPSLFKRFKTMYKEYWYVLVPVHVVTSTIWFGSFYYIASSGIDLVSLFETIGAPEYMIDKLKSGGHSTAAYFAITSAMYKLATPLRYMVTLGGSMVSIKYLKEWGYIKPIPPKEKLKEIYHEKKDIFIGKKENFISKIFNKFRFK